MYRPLRIFWHLTNGHSLSYTHGSKYKRTERSRLHIKAIRKGHRFVESDLRLLLLNKHKKFEDDAIARFAAACFHCPGGNKKNPKHGNRFNNNIDREYLSVNKYARCRFIDYSSAFNTMQPHTLINRLAEYNIPARPQLFVLDFLTNRKQYVRTEIELCSTTSINTGAPQGCVLSAFLFIIYTNTLSLCSTTSKIIKYADDAVVIGLINNDNEQEYRDTVSYVSSWCNENHLNLNAGKTKEMIFDFRKIQNNKAPIIINNTSVKQVPSYKYLGVIIQNNLK